MWTATLANKGDKAECPDSEVKTSSRNLHSVTWWLCNQLRKTLDLYTYIWTTTVANKGGKT